MKRDKILSCLTSMALTFLLGFGGVACMASGLALPVDYAWLALGCAVIAVAASVCCVLPHGGAVLAGAGTLCGIFSLYSDTFWDQSRSFLLEILTIYDKGYGWGVPAWLGERRTETLIWPLLILAGLAMAVSAWTVCRGKRAYVAVPVAILPLCTCLVVTDTVPEVRWLFVLLLGVVLMMLTQTVRRQNAGQGNYLTGLLALPVAAALAGLFWMMPKADFDASEQMRSLQELADVLLSKLPFLDMTSGGDLVISFGGQSSGQLDLSAVGPKTQRLSPVMEVVADFNGTLYLRRQDYDGYDGMGWSSTEGRTEPDLTPGSGWLRERGNLSVRTYGRWDTKFVPYYPDTALTLENGKVPNPDKLNQYEYICLEPVENWQTTWRTQYGDYPTMDGSPCLALPEDTRQRAEAILNTVLSYEQRQDPLLAVQAISNYVNQSAVYDLQTARMPAGETDFALWFLESSETGYCVHFASATAVLLRAAGIPARYVEGYMTDVTRNNTNIINQSMAHAWVEYYLDGIGWLVLDSTPSAPEPEQTTRPTPPPHTETEPSETTAPTEDTEPIVTAPTAEPTQPATTAPTATTTPPTTPSTQPGQYQSGTAGESGGASEPTKPRELPVWFVTLLQWFARIAVAGLAVIGQWILRRYLKTRRMRQGSTNAQALARYREVKLVAWLWRIPVPDALTDLAEKAGFSQHTITRAELTRFNAFLREGVGELRTKPWYFRFAARFIFAVY